MFWENKDKTKVLKNKYFNEWFEYFFKLHSNVPKFSNIASEQVSTIFDLSRIITASFPRMIYEETRSKASLEELRTISKEVKKITETEQVFRFRDIEDMLLNNKDFNINKIVTTKQLSKKEYEIIKEVKKIILKNNKIVSQNLLKNLELENENIKRHEKNIDVVKNSTTKVFTIINDSHFDEDICDDYIGGIYKDYELVPPPYHTNCRCEIREVEDEQ